MDCDACEFQLVGVVHYGVFNYNVGYMFCIRFCIINRKRRNISFLAKLPFLTKWSRVLYNLRLYYIDKVMF